MPTASISASATRCSAGISYVADFIDELPGLSTRIFITTFGSIARPRFPRNREQDAPPRWLRSQPPYPRRSPCIPANAPTPLLRQSARHQRRFLAHPDRRTTLPRTPPDPFRNPRHTAESKARQIRWLP